MVLLSACGASIHYVSPRLLKRLGCQAQDDFNLPRLFASTSEYSRLQNALEARGRWMAGKPSYAGKRLAGR